MNQNNQQNNSQQNIGYDPTELPIFDLFKPTDSQGNPILQKFLNTAPDTRYNNNNVKGFDVGEEIHRMLFPDKPYEAKTLEETVLAEKNNKS